jgi:hypothetical protein
MAQGQWNLVPRPRITGRELLTKSLRNVTSADDLAADLARIQLVREDKIGSYEIGKPSAQGRSDHLIEEDFRLRMQGRRSIDYFVSVIENISARKQAEKELRENEERSSGPAMSSDELD